MSETIYMIDSKQHYLVTLHDNGNLEVKAQANEIGEYPALAMESKGKGHIILTPVK